MGGEAAQQLRSEAPESAAPEERSTTGHFIEYEHPEEWPTALQARSLYWDLSSGSPGPTK